MIPETGYQPSEAGTMITLSALAYLEEQSNDYSTIWTAIESYLTGKNGDGYATGTEWVLRWLGLTQDGENLMYLAEHASVLNTYAFAIRGTDFHDLDDIIEDAYVFRTGDFPYAHPSNPDIKIAKGSLIGLFDLITLPGITLDNKQPHISIQEYLQGDDFKTKIKVELPLWLYTTGHSLGGALASLFTSWLISPSNTVITPNTYSQINFKTYTFASPTVGNEAYAEYYQAQGNTANTSFEGFRIHNLQDVVPYLCSDLSGIVHNGIPFGFWGKGLVDVCIGLVQGILLVTGSPYYVQVGVDVPLDNKNGKPKNWHHKHVNTPSEIEEWLLYEHGCANYQQLLGVKPISGSSSKSIAYNSLP